MVSVGSIGEQPKLSFDSTAVAMRSLRDCLVLLGVCSCLSGANGNGSGGGGDDTPTTGTTPGTTFSTVTTPLRPVRVSVESLQNTRWRTHERRPKPNQDAYAALSWTQPTTGTGTGQGLPVEFYAVFDGHGGGDESPPPDYDRYGYHDHHHHDRRDHDGEEPPPHLSAELSRTLPQLFQENLMTVEPPLSSAEEERTLSTEDEEKVRRVLLQTIVHVDRQFCLGDPRSPMGSTAVLMVRIKDAVILANIGDSRALLRWQSSSKTAAAKHTSHHVHNHECDKDHHDNDYDDEPETEHVVVTEDHKPEYVFLVT